MVGSRARRRLADLWGGVSLHETICSGVAMASSSCVPVPVHMYLCRVQIQGALDGWM